MSASVPIYFDFDGTLVDTFPGLFDAVNWLRRRNDLPAAGVEEVRGWIGGGIDALLRGAVPGEDPEDLRETFLDYYQGEPLLASRPYPGIASLLDGLQGRPLAIVTNKHETSVFRLLDHLDWTDRFVAVVCPAGALRKPDPGMVRRARELAGIASDEGWFVGDSGFDIETGRNAGLATVAVTWGFRTREQLEACGPDHLVDHPRQLAALVRSERVPS